MIDTRIDFKKLVAANRILAHEGVVDAFGHVSVRHPDNPQRYVMSRARAPELVEFNDLMEFELDGEVIDPQDRMPYGERMIHGAVFEAREEINAVVHNHSYAVLPFTITKTPLRPIVHTCSVIGNHIPVWDIRTEFGETDMLVRTMEQGRNLVETLGPNTCTLMRGHGAVIAGKTLEEAVMTSIYLQVNASIQTEAMRMGEITSLTPEEVEQCTQTQFSPLGMERSWEYYCVRAGIEVV